MRPAGGNGLADRVRIFLAERTSYHIPDPVLVGVSGGVDSVVLAWALRELGIPVVLAHVHHGLRGVEADEDARSVAELGDRIGCPVDVLPLPEGWQEEAAGASTQDRARSLRYDALVRAASKHDLGYVAVGHNLDDQAETVLLQLARGSGPEGLAAMKACRPLGDLVLLRPLLGISRDEIREYATSRGLAWREDASNAAVYYRRNAVRNELLPVFSRITGSDVAGRIARSADLVRAYVDADLTPLVEALLIGGTRRLSDVAGEVRLDVLTTLPVVWRQRLLLQAAGRWLPGAPRDQVLARRMALLVDAQTGRRVIVPGGAVWRERDGIAFVPDVTVPAAIEVAPGDVVPWAGRVVSVREVAQTGPGEDDTSPRGEGDRWSMPGMTRPVRMVLDPRSGPLELRCWEPGDRLRPAGGRGVRKVKDVLTDAEYPCHARASAPVIVQDGKVVCVVGVRCDESVAPRSDSTCVIEIRVDAGV